MRTDLGQAGLDNGAETIAWHLKKAGLFVPAASTHWRLSDGSDVEILNWLDDHSRFLLYCKVMTPVKEGDVVRSFQPSASTIAQLQEQLDRVDAFGKTFLRRAGKMHHLGAGRGHVGKAVTALVDEIEVMVIDQGSGEMISKHTIDPEKNYWVKKREIKNK